MQVMKASNQVTSFQTSRSPLRVACVARPAGLSHGSVSASAQPSTLTPSQSSISGPGFATLALMGPLLTAQAALASGGENGILEGRAAALIHPAMEFFLLGASLYAGYLGWQWRRTRELGDEIRSLRTAAPQGADGTALPNPALEAKEQERKTLLAGNFKDKHHNWGSLLLAAGVGIAIEGAANTFMRTGKLFPGPHLYFGALICALWALAAAMVPAMQKGNNTARNAHIALNGLQVFLFLSQVPTGLEIVGKVFEFTVWP